MTPAWHTTANLSQKYSTNHQISTRIAEHIASISVYTHSVCFRVRFSFKRSKCLYAHYRGWEVKTLDHVTSTLIFNQLSKLHKLIHAHPYIQTANNTWSKSHACTFTNLCLAHTLSLKAVVSHLYRSMESSRKRKHSLFQAIKSSHAHRNMVSVFSKE